MSGRSSTGFTLLEVLVVISIVGLLATLALFGLPAIQDRTLVLTVSARFLGLVSQARAISVRTTEPVMIVFSSGHIRLESRIKNVDIPLDDRVKVELVSAREISQNASPAIQFVGDGTTTGAKVSFTSGHYGATYSISWLDGAISQTE